jgi:hypothetical protein
MGNFDLEKAVRRFVDSVLADDDVSRKRYRNLLEDDFSEAALFLRRDIGMILEAYTNQRIEPAANMPNAVWPCIDHCEFKADIPRIAERYLSLSELHADRVSDFLCGALLDSEIYPLAREMENPRLVLPTALGEGAAYNLQRREKGSGFATAGAVLLLVMAVVLLASTAYFGAMLAGGAGVWIFATKSRNRKALTTALGEISGVLRTAHGKLTLIRDEISRGSYDRSAIVSRLKAAEASDIYIPSIVYSVLAVRSVGGARA